MNGEYSITLDSGFSYNLAPSKSNDLNSGNGVSSLDILMMRRHILGTPLTSPYKIIAADVNSSGSVSTTDILLVRSLILQNITAFPGNKLWAFVPHDFVFADSTNPFPHDTSRYYASASQLTGQDFIGMKLGDVNNSWDPNIPKNESFAGKIYLQMDCIEPRYAGEEITIPVRAKQFDGVSGMQFTLSWDKEALTFQSVQSGILSADFATQKANEGKLGVLWTDERAEGKSITGDEVLFTLKFIANSVGEECDINISSAMIPVEAVNGNLELIELEEWKDSPINESSNGYRVYQNYPNPFSGSTVVSFELPVRENVTIEVFDLVGKKIYEQVGMHEPGRNNIEFNWAQISAGIHYVSVRTNNFNKSITIVCQTD